MSANQFALKHREVEIEYNIGVTPGLPVLTYQDASGRRSFTATEVRTDETAGVYEDFGGPDSVPARPTSWRSIELHGEALDVIQPKV